jgi:hypothetical protein
MPDRQIHPLGQEDAPAGYSIPSAAELGIKSAYATFDGSGAGVPFVPLLRIISDGGTITDEIPQDVTVAAGASADATWFPHIGAGTVSAALSTLPFAYITSTGGTTHINAGATVRLPAAGATFYTNSGTVYGTAVNAGITGISIKAPGHYLTNAQAAAVAPQAAGIQYEVVTLGGANVASFEGGKTVAFISAGALTDQSRVEENLLMSVTSADVPTSPLIAEIANTAAGAVDLELGGIYVVQLDTDQTVLG